MEKIRIGQIHSAAFSGVGFGQILPMVRVLDLPFLFKDNSEADLVHKALKGFFSDQFRKKGFELLAWAEVGNVHLFSKNPIRNINDLSMQKICMDRKYYDYEMLHARKFTCIIITYGAAGQI